MAANHGMHPTHYREDGPRPGELVFTRAGVRSLDAAATSELGLPSIVLMENAAMALERACAALAGDERAVGVIACGPGNNGGDGLALARRLMGRGWEVIVALAADAEKFTGDAGLNHRAADGLGVRMVGPVGADAAARRVAVNAAGPVIAVDCLFGTGLTRAIEGPAATLVALLNGLRVHAGAAVVAADLPSGLDADTGEPLGAFVVRADRTVTFAGWKVGLTTPGAREFTGDVVVGGIGVPGSFARRFALSGGGTEQR